MTIRNLILALLCLVAVAAIGIAQDKANSSSDRWHIKGALSEACTCNVPCTCNFGESPSPHKYCYAVWSYEIKEGDFNGIKLDGLKFGGANGKRGMVVYIDSSADERQRKALEAIAAKVMNAREHASEGIKPLGIKYVAIKQQYDDKQSMVEIGGGVAGFKARYIMGMDGSKPVIVVNNTSWAIREAIKGKTEYLMVKDEFGNRFSVNDTNANQGDFDYNDQTDFSRSDFYRLPGCLNREKSSGKDHKH